MEKLCLNLVVLFLWVFSSGQVLAALRADTHPQQPASLCAALTSEQSRNGEEIQFPNLVARRLFGEWETESSLSTIFSPWIDGTRWLMAFEEDLGAVVHFDNRYGCAYTSGKLTYTVLANDDHVFSISSPFMLASVNGNLLIVAAEGGHVSSELIRNTVIAYVALSPAPQTFDDTLFFGRDSDHDFVAMKRSKDL